MADQRDRAEYHKEYRIKNKEVIRERSAKYRRENLEKTRAACRKSARIYREENLEEVRKKNRETLAKIMPGYRKKYPEKIKARRVINNAIRDGKITRQKCWCGEDGQAHHEDYNKPYDIKWLCSEHHAERHREMRDYAGAKG